MGGDQVLTDFAIASGVTPIKVEKDATPTLLQVPLNGFRRSNGLWAELEATIQLQDTGNFSATFQPWFKFASLAQYFLADPSSVQIGGLLAFSQASSEDVYGYLSVSAHFLVKLPAQSSDVAPIAIPDTDDLLVGIAAVGTVDISVNKTSGIVVGEINEAIVTQAPQIGLITLP